MPDEELVEGSEVLEEGETETPETATEDPTIILAQRIAALEVAQRQSVAEIRSAVGRVQSLSAKLDKANDPQVEAKLRTELAGVSDLLGLVTDSIDESILPRDIKRRVSDAQVTARAQATDAEINRRIAAATAPTEPVITTNVDTNLIEAAVVSQIQGLGLNDKDPAFDWVRAGMLLNTQGQAAMWSYFGEIEKQLLADSNSDGGPKRRGTTAPKAASAAAPTAGVDRFLDKTVSDADKIAEMRAQGILN